MVFWHPVCPEQSPAVGTEAPLGDVVAALNGSTAGSTLFLPPTAGQGLHPERDPARDTWVPGTKPQLSLVVLG